VNEFARRKFNIALCGSGRIGRVHAANLAPYVAAKAGLAGVTRNAAHAHRWDQIRINGINIGWTATDGEDLIQRRFHGAGDDWLEKANASVPMGRRSATLSCLPKVPAGSTVDLRRALARLELT